jgi:hypothetical protein
MGRLLLTHFDRVKRTVATLSPASAFAFGAACAERQWGVYERASAGRPWERREVLRPNLDAIWSWLEGGEAEPLVSASACEDAIHEAGDDVADDLGFHVANSYFGLVALVEEDDPGHVYLMAQSNLNLLDAFLHEVAGLAVSPESARAVYDHQLVQAEMRHQLDDLALLAVPATPALVEQVRRKAEGVSLLGDWWEQGTAAVERGWGPRP